jgi:Fic family protein
MTFIPDQPYNELPLLPPGRELWETMEVYKQLTLARAALAELKGRAPVIPNPMMLINTLVLQEAKDSSSIENIFTTSDKLYRAFAASTGETDKQTKEVVRYRQALWDGWQKVKSEGLSLKIVEDIYRTIKEMDDGIRDTPVFVGTLKKVVYTPPCCKKVLTEKLKNWIEFANAEDGIDPLIKMALLHYQFEAIHPFTDGNGRTGRVLNVLFISLKNLLDQPILYLSKYINDNRNEYYRLLNYVTANDSFEEWVLFMLKGVSETARNTLQKVNAIHELFIKTQEKVKKDLPGIYSHELLELLFNQPYCKIGFIVDAGLASRNTAGKYLSELEKAGILVMEKSGNEFLYLNKGLFDILSGAKK